MSKIMFRASVVEVVGSNWLADPASPNDPPSRWLIPVLFRSRDEAISAAVKAAKRKIERFGGDWKIEIERERVVIV